MEKTSTNEGSTAGSNITIGTITTLDQMIKDRKKALAVAQAKEAEENCIAVPYGDFGDRYERDHQYEIAIYSLDSSGNIIKHHEKASGTRIHSLSQDLHLFVISHAQEDKCEPSKAQLWQFYNFSPPAVEEKNETIRTTATPTPTQTPTPTPTATPTPTPSTVKQILPIVIIGILVIVVIIILRSRRA